jgi:hypothetical protein
MAKANVSSSYFAARGTRSRRASIAPFSIFASLIAQ